tara:strand:+ start:57704 stop:58942 length:1239 start_codon:yes stop_codon:yes gene_type:complete
MLESLKDKFRLLGPGLLYAAAAIGVSHVVQSTRAGAEFGYQLIFAVFLANFIKYPFFKVGPLFTALTGKSLLEGYKKLGKHWVMVFLIMTLLTMFVVQAAVTVVTAGLVQSILGLSLDIRVISLILLIICFLILYKGKYNILDQFIKVIVIILSITTVLALFFAFFAHIPKPAMPISFDFNNKTHVLFLIALIGWMPAPMDIPVWHSVWCMADNEDKKCQKSVKDSILDFNIGFIGTALLAMCFVALGALVMYQTGESFKSSGGAFASQVISLYTKALGTWSYPLIALATFATMFSTTLACLDAFARITKEGLYQFSEKEVYRGHKAYLFWLLITLTGASILHFFFLKDMRQLVDFATTLSFVISPVFAYMNYQVMQKQFAHTNHGFHGLNKLWAYLGMAFLSFFALYYLYI